MKPLWIVTGGIFLLAMLIAGCDFSGRGIGQTVTDTSAKTAEPALAADADGRLYLVYVEHAEDTSADVYLQKFSADLSRAGERVRINPQPGSARAWVGDPPTIGLGSDGSIYIGWTSRPSTGDGTDLNLSVSHDGGVTFDTPVKVNNDSAPASHGMHSLAVDDDGSIYMAWLDERNVRPDPKAQYAEQHAGSHEPEPNSEVFFAVSSDGGRSFSPNKRIASNVCPCCKTAIAAAPGGRVYVAWRQVVGDNFRHLAVASSSDRGDNFAAAAIVSDDQWQIAACPVSGPALAADGDKLQVFWYTAGSAGQSGVYASESEDGGRTFLPRRLVSADAASGTPSLADRLSGELVFCQREQKIAVARPSGSSPVEIADGSAPSAVLANGKVVVAYVSNDGNLRSVRLLKKGVGNP